MANTITDTKRMALWGHRKVLQQLATEGIVEPTTAEYCMTEALQEDHTSKIMMMAYLGTVPPYTRLITFYKRYTKTYEDTFVMLLPANAVIPEDDERNNLTDDTPANRTYQQLLDYDGKSIDSSEVDEKMLMVGINEVDVPLDPANTYHMEAVRIHANDHLYPRYPRETIIDPVSVAKV